MLAMRLTPGLASAPVEVMLRNGRVLRVSAGADLTLVARFCCKPWDEVRRIATGWRAR